MVLGQKRKCQHVEESGLLTDSERKMNRSEVSSKWNKCRIYVGDQLDSWNELKEVLRFQTRAELQIFCLIGKPNMFFPSFLNHF